MKKKLMALVMAGVMSVSVLAGCGGSEPAAPADDTTASAPADDTTASAPAGDTSSDSGELTFADLQSNYAALTDAYDQVVALYADESVAQDDNVEAALAEADEIIAEMGELTEADFDGSDDYVALNDSMISMVDVLSNIVDSMSAADDGSAAASDAAEVSYTYDTGFYVNDGSSDAVLCLFVGDDGSQVAYLNDGSEELFAEYDVAQAELEDGTPYVLVQIGDAVLGYLSDGEDWYIVNGDGEVAVAAELSAEEAEAILETVAQ